ncbi:hypothetical protein DL93DRAFT_2096192 [Clavulina sp. PMI_390]|nr:hypothetical protein DL93DRAFT_2096192 [Clavulina sp. PMI_390]
MLRIDFRKDGTYEVLGRLVVIVCTFTVVVGTEDVRGSLGFALEDVLVDPAGVTPLAVEVEVEAGVEAGLAEATGEVVEAGVEEATGEVVDAGVEEEGVGDSEEDVEVDVEVGVEEEEGSALVLVSEVGATTTRVAPGPEAVEVDAVDVVVVGTVVDRVEEGGDDDDGSRLDDEVLNEEEEVDTNELEDETGLWDRAMLGAYRLITRIQGFATRGEEEEDGEVEVEVVVGAGADVDVDLGSAEETETVASVPLPAARRQPSIRIAPLFRRTAVDGIGNGWQEAKEGERLLTGRRRGLIVRAQAMRWHDKQCRGIEASEGESRSAIQITLDTRNSGVPIGAIPIDREEEKEPKIEIEGVLELRLVEGARADQPLEGLEEDTSRTETRGRKTNRSGGAKKKQRTDR